MNNIFMLHVNDNNGQKTNPDSKKLSFIKSCMHNHTSKKMNQNITIANK